tara:strand:+ start:117009 stop:117428 length:420 start_codon:yes stop_codon:yes gene_type:complete
MEPDVADKIWPMASPETVRESFRSLKLSEEVTNILVDIYTEVHDGVREFLNQDLYYVNSVTSSELAPPGLTREPPSAENALQWVADQTGKDRSELRLVKMGMNTFRIEVEAGIYDDIRFTKLNWWAHPDTVEKRREETE